MAVITDTTRWTAVPNDDALFVIDILVAAPNGGHVAGVIGVHDDGKPCATTYAHANLIANAPLLLLAEAGPRPLRRLFQRLRRRNPERLRPGCRLGRCPVRGAARADRGDRRRDQGRDGAIASPHAAGRVVTGSAAMSRSARRRALLAHRAERRRPAELHIFSFRFPEVNGVRHEASVLVRGKMGQTAAIGPAYDQAGLLGRGSPFCANIRTVPAPRPTPALDALCARCTASPTLVALLTAPAGYRPSLRLDLLGRDGAALARAYDRIQAAWGDPRRAFVTGRIPCRAAIRPCRSVEA